MQVACANASRGAEPAPWKFRAIPQHDRRLWRWPSARTLHPLFAARGVPGIMTDAEFIRFVAHYERLTRQILIDLPGRSGCVTNLDADPRAVRIRPR